MAEQYDENGNLIPPGGGDPGQGAMTPEEIAKMRADLDKAEASRAELEKKLSETGEKLSQTEAALNVYKRGQPSDPGPGGGEPPADKPVDILENPEQWARNFETRVTGIVVNLVDSLEKGKKIRDEFFAENEDLKPAAELADNLMSRYVAENRPDFSKPGEKQKAFDAVAKLTRETAKKFASVTGAPPKSPHFETGGGVGGGDNPPNPAGPFAPKSAAEMEQEGVEDFVGSQRKLRTKRGV